MFEGRLLAIAVASAAGEPMRSIEEIRAVPGRGLEGDRYGELLGKFQKGSIEPQQEVSLIEREAIAAASQGYDLSFEHLDTRRNLLTEGVPLNHLVGRRFSVGGVILEGVKLCEPCAYLEKITACSGIEKSLIHRGGLRARIVEGGSICAGQPIRPA